MSDTARLRLFVAASIPDEHLRWVEANTRDLRERSPLARWASSSAQHVTLKFLGDTAPDLLAGVEEACSEVALSHSGSDLSLGSLGAFPSAKRARVLWIGLLDPSRVLTSLAAGLDRRLGPLGFEIESRPYTPHLTLARFRVPQPLELTGLPPVPGPFPLHGFHLWRSHLSAHGTRYEALRAFPLGSDGSP